MDMAFVSSSGMTYRTTGSSMTISAPSSYSNNDLILLIITSGDTFLGNLSSTGWTLLGTATSGGSTKVYYRYASGTLSSAVLNGWEDGDAGNAGIMIAYRGNLSSDAIDAVATDTGSGTSIHITNPSTATDDETIINCIGKETGSMSNWSNTSLVNIVEDVDAYSATIGIAVAHGKKPTSGATNVTNVNTQYNIFHCAVSISVKTLPTATSSGDFFAILKR